MLSIADVTSIRKYLAFAVRSRLPQPQQRWSEWTSCPTTRSTITFVGSADTAFETTMIESVLSLSFADFASCSAVATSPCFLAEALRTNADLDWYERDAIGSLSHTQKLPTSSSSECTSGANRPGKMHETHGPTSLRLPNYAQMQRTTKGGQGISWIHSWRIKHSTGLVSAQMEIQFSRTSEAVVTGMALVLFHNNNRFLAVVNGWVSSLIQQINATMTQNSCLQKINSIKGLIQYMWSCTKWKLILQLSENYFHLKLQTPRSDVPRPLARYAIWLN